MEVILLERVAKLGQMGEVVRVKDGFARNFLLKRGKALRATADNQAKFDGMKAELEANNLKAKGEAAKVAEKIDGRDIVVIRQASESGQLFGSVTRARHRRGTGWAAPASASTMSRTVTEPNNWPLSEAWRMITISRPSIFSATLAASPLAFRLLASSSAFMPSNLALLSAVARSALPRWSEESCGRTRP